MSGISIVTWNINGIRARADAMIHWVNENKPDVLCLQEVKASEEQIPENVQALASSYCFFWNGSTVKKGYSGTGIWVKRTFIDGLGLIPHWSVPSFDIENRILEIELGNYVIIGVYIPRGEKEDHYKIKLNFLSRLSQHISKHLAEKKEVVLCGDMNVAHRDIDVYYPKIDPTMVGLRPDERTAISNLIGIEKTRSGLFEKLTQVFTEHKSATKEFFDDLEMALLSSDVGVDMTEWIIKAVSTRAKKDSSLSLDVLVKEEMKKIFDQSVIQGNNLTFENTLPNKPYVVLVVGVNGTGKTTTLGKLGYLYKQAGKSVMYAAGDTYRAAAAQQLAIWAERNHAQIVMHQPGSDPAAVAHDAVESAVAKGIDVLLIDTAGRLHNKTNLMQELTKIKRVTEKKLGRTPNEILLVIDANTGQNSVTQAKVFGELAGVTGLILTKLDGTAKGGAVLEISKKLGTPIRYVGVGEKNSDLKHFDPDAFVNAMLK
ncbi:hypothetical protein CHS0354_024104 [Potamilus streckersoni]|uniref:DNA-(apurinic or apyrimidinic site) endonuclease n=1 Tax=Potamilus streckersoni TaxID=2493646 RepID=A0AAE0S078_9BIVA|nr:hypothetical protein CHS0354_024104 [Potamilus streckersoni]